MMVCTVYPFNPSIIAVLQCICVVSKTGNGDDSLSRSIQTSVQPSITQSAPAFFSLVQILIKVFQLPSLITLLHNSSYIV